MGNIFESDELLEGDTTCPHCGVDLSFASDYYGEYVDTQCPECANIISVDGFNIVEGE